MILSINQPAYLPWLGYFHRIAVSDAHVVLDHVQFEKNSYTNRNRLVVGGKTTWLTVPVRTKGRFGDLAISRLEIDNNRNWRQKHWRTIEQGYRGARYFADYAPALEQIYVQPWDRLVDLCHHMLELFLDWLNIETPLSRSSELNLVETKSDLVLEICTRMGAGTYFSGALGRDYLDEPSFANRNIGIVYQNYRHPIYEQGGTGDFSSHLGVLDLLFNHGPESLRIIMDGQLPIQDLRHPSYLRDTGERRSSGR